MPQAVIPEYIRSNVHTLAKRGDHLAESIISILDVLEPLSGGGGSGVAGQTIEVVASTSAQSELGNGVSYIPLVQGNGDTIDFQFVAADDGDIEVVLVYRMSVANGGDVELQLSHLITSAGDDPTAATTSESAFTVTPGNDVNQHVVDGETASSTLKQTVSKGDHVYMKIQRPTGGGDSHTGDMQILAIGVRAA